MIDLAAFDRDGFFITPQLLSHEEVESLKAKLEATTQPEAIRGGIRDVMEQLPELRAVASHPTVRRIVNAVLGEMAFVVRATLFDKTGHANWKVPWHQDVTIAVRERRETAGYGPWSVKNGVIHVQPPSTVLESMVTVRIHIDQCPASNGALRVIPGSQHLGRIDQNQASAYVEEGRVVTCEARSGEALVMRPLLLHASSASQQPIHRRVLHFDYANVALANGLQWRLD